MIDGLPTVNDRQCYGVAPGAGLVPYCARTVVGGAGRFVMVAKSFDRFAASIGRKFLQEIA